MFKFLPSIRRVAIGATGALIYALTVFPSGLHAQGAENNFCAQLLTAHPAGGSGLRAEVQTLVAASPGVAKDIHSCACPAEGAEVSVLPNAGQGKAIGSGLANALKKIKNPDVADEIKGLIAQSCSEELKTAFLKGTEDQTAAIDEGGDGAGDDGGATAAPGFGPIGRRAPTLAVNPGGNGTGGGAVSPN